VQETTIFREFGPLTGSTMRLAYEVAPKIGNSLTRQTVDTDARKYFRIGGTGLLALRARGFKSWGGNPGYTFFGGNGELRGYDFLSFVGQNAFFLNSELRLPLIHAMATPIGILGGIRASLFANVGGASWQDVPFKAFNRGTTIEQPVLGYDADQNPILGPQIPISGFRLQDARGSYGISLMTFALGFPMHFDWSWRTLLNKEYEDVVFAANGGSSAFRKPRFTFWIGYDF
jgi:outer membrane protein assembly factor BamA